MIKKLLILFLVFILGNSFNVSASNQEEMKGVWISFYELEAKNKDEFEKKIDKYFKRSKEFGLNTVFVHVHAFSDALYKSKYFPYSKNISSNGKYPGYDPLQLMVDKAKKYDLKIHAWYNPYRISYKTDDINDIPKNSIIYKWKKTRNVLKYDGRYYLNPAKKDVRDVIIKDIVDIVKNYDIDGIHFDDYFYPNLGKNYKKNFDYKEYKEYLKTNKNINIVQFRRENVNKLVKGVYQAIKKVDKDVEYGISPFGRLDFLYSNNNYYADVKTWLKGGYVDYLAPQIYWSFNHKTVPYNKMVDSWANLPKSDSVKLYTGIGTYKANYKDSADNGFKNNIDVFINMVDYNRFKNLSGEILFSIGSLFKDYDNIKNLEGYYNYEYDEEYIDFDEEEYLTEDELFN